MLLKSGHILDEMSHFLTLTNSQDGVKLYLIEVYAREHRLEGPVLFVLSNASETATKFLDYY